MPELPCVQLELTFFHTAGPDYTVALRLARPGAVPELRLPPVELRLDHDRLLACLPDIAGYGGALWSQLFGQEALRSALIMARASADSLGCPLRVMFCLDPGDVALHSVFWETLRSPESDGFVGARERFRIVRALSGGGLSPPVPSGAARLRAVVIAASPADITQFGLSAIDIGQQIQLAEQALGGMFDIAVVARDRTAPATLVQIAESLRGSPDLLYLICHGTCMPEGSYLWLEDEQGLSQRVRAEQLAELIEGLAHPPALAVLNTCYGAVLASGDRATVGIGAHLAGAGAQSVIAMQGPISIDTAIRFMRVFFLELGQSAEVDRAVTIARRAVIDRPDWWMPVLFLRSHSAQLWDVAGTRAAALSEDQEGEERGRGKLLQHVLQEWHARWPADQIALPPRLRLEGLAAASLAPGGGERGQQVRAWETTQAAEDLPEEILSRAGRSLLVLGPPGSGKTALLLCIGHALLARAAHDASRPISIMINLAEWAGQPASLKEWLLVELHRRFDIQRSAASLLLEQSRLALLFDGMSSIEAGRRPDVVDALNEFLLSCPCRAVVTLRLADYLVQATPPHGEVMVLAGVGAGDPCDEEAEGSAELAALLAAQAQALAPGGATTPAGEPPLTPKQRAVASLERDDLARSLRVEVARALGRAGDPRFPVTVADWERAIRSLGTSDGGWRQYWCSVRPGTYEVGGGIVGDAGGERAATIPLRQLWVARYPITVAQYQTFLDVGYGPEAYRWWTPRGWQWKQQSKRERPGKWGEPGYNLGNQPVVAITWYEAMAFAAWLSAQCRSVLPVGCTLRLPTEAEWEVAATVDQWGERRPYPWGGAEPTPERVFFGDRSELPHPPPVGCLPGGQAAHGAMDMAGTVWETVVSSYRGYPAQSHERLADCAPQEHDIVWRGGSWAMQGERLRMSLRSKSSPQLMDRDLGFRLVIAWTGRR